MQIHAVKTKDGHYLDGSERAEVIEALIHDKTTCTINHTTMEIISHKADENGDKETIIKVVR